MTQEDLENKVKNKVDAEVDDMFTYSHMVAGTTSGDITPEQHGKLEALKEELTKLIVEQTMQNL